LYHTVTLNKSSVLILFRHVASEEHEATAPKLISCSGHLPLSVYTVLSQCGLLYY